MQYAKETSVPVEKSRAEIEKIVSRYGAKGFLSGWEDDMAMITFKVRERQIRFMLRLPDSSAREFHFTQHKQTQRTPEQAYQAWEQACRQRWRALLLSVKAKLEAVESGIAEFEQEFMPYIVIPATGQTIAETILPQMESVLTSGKLPPLLPGPVV